MEIVLRRVRNEQKEVLYRLLQYSLFEESMTDLNEMTEEAVFEYAWFDAYFTDPLREAFFIRAARSEKLLGFVMVNTHMQARMEGHSIAEFMVLPRYRRNGIGKKAAFACFALHEGTWEVSPSYGSDSAYRFWKDIVESYTHRCFVWNGTTFVFEAKHRKEE